MSFFFIVIVVVIVIIAAALFIYALRRTKQVHDLTPPEAEKHASDPADFESNG